MGEKNMQVSKVFLINISILITLAYLMNLGFKYALKHLSLQLNMCIAVCLFIFSGWLTMLFGLRITDQAIIDMRVIPLITGVFIFRNPLLLLVIGVGIGLSRFTFGVNEAAIAGFVNMVILGVVAALLCHWFHRSWKSFVFKMGISILVIDIINTLNISILGIIPFAIYMKSYVPTTLPISLILSCFFIFILRDFYKELRRTERIKHTNELLRRQKKALQEAKLALEDKANQLELASKYKSDFLATMSHELKTPLNSIILLTELLKENQEGRFTKDEQQYLGIIHSSGEELLRQINDILDLSKVEAGKLDVHLEEEVNLTEIPLILYNQFQPQSAQKGVRFDIQLAENLPDLIQTDGLRIHQILRNLLSNAFKFTEKGFVLLELTRTDTAPDGTLGDWIAFAVTDTGIGIANDKQRIIFEAFRQADGSINRQYGGTGLGLSISLELTKLLGGQLAITSDEGKGSAFTLYVPAVRKGD
jgi:signal transduction histidine kinase